MSAVDAEAARQQRLVAALLAAQADPGPLAVREDGARAMRGLQAYRANADASAERALATAFPTVKMLVGEDDFRQLSHEFWRAHPPRCGDLGEWGEGFADVLDAHAQLRDWPYLGDCARLDWTVHCCERAEDVPLDAESIARLGDTDPSRLVLRAAPGLALVESSWPIGAIHDAHRSDDASAFDVVRQAIAAQQGETVLVARRDWKAVPVRVGAGTAAWIRLLLAGLALDAMLARAPQDVDFATWLTAALQGGWVKGISVRSD
ncbi:DNA-binding domain-containing protein [Piscinibacter sp.]|uniref:DNA-binding domain-containing protein n=1 Tax=Piscinibacter sp. TaxID=1903157 RepID=UPI002B6E0481|nr:DNA-binding domain-containing protein [Albitalea sp.]HUG20899.1 DNA-binding domain-containing protein [Albitalea sp.]